MSADRPDWTPQAATQSWKLTLPCTKAEAERLAGDVPEIEALDPAPVLMTSEPDPAREDDWQLDAYFEGEPTPQAVALVRSLVPSAAGIAAAAQPVAEEDWVTKSQQWLAPIHVGRFYVHTAAHADTVPAGTTAFHIEAARAFGTGHHETTTGCLEMLDRMAGDGLAFANLIDVGTGTGLLAFAARALWPAACVTASDIDPISIEVTADNMAANAIPADAIALVAAPGLDDPALAAGAPYDLVIANILAGPLIDLAPDLAGALAPGGSIVLAGLLDTQAEAVTAAYVAQGLRPADRITRGDWPTLRLTRG